MVNMVSGIARGRDLSPTAAVSRRHGDLSHAGLANKRVYISLMTLDDHFDRQLSKQKTRWPVSHDHIAGSDVVSEDVNRRRSRARWRPKIIYMSTWVNSSMQLTSLQFDREIHFMVTDSCQTRYPLTNITWPHRGLKCRSHRGKEFFKVHRWPG